MNRTHLQPLPLVCLFVSQYLVYNVKTIFIVTIVIKYIIYLPDNIIKILITVYRGQNIIGASHSLMRITQFIAMFTQCTHSVNNSGFLRLKGGKITRNNALIQMLLFSYLSKISLIASTASSRPLKAVSRLSIFSDMI